MLILDFAVQLLPVAAFLLMGWQAPLTLPVFVLPFLMMLWQGISVASLETGAYSQELMTTTFRTGASLRFAAASLALVLAYGFVSRVALRGFREDAAAGRTEAPPTMLALLVALAAASAAGLMFYAPTVPDFARRLFLESNPEPIRDLIFKYLPFVAFGAGFSAVLSRQTVTRYSAYLSIMALVYVLVRFGNKFSGIADLCGSFYMAVLIIFASSAAARRRWRECAMGTCALALFSMMAMNHAFGAYIHRSDKPAAAGPIETELETRASGRNYLMERIFLMQGGLWWVTDHRVVSNEKPAGLAALAQYTRQYPDLDDPLNAFLIEKGVSYERMRYVVIEKGSPYTGTFPAIFYELAGPWGPVLFCLLTGAVLALCASYLAAKVAKQQILLAFIALSILLPVYNTASSGEFLRIHVPHLAVKVGLALAAEFCLRKKWFPKPATAAHEK